jgi:REP element-mobilizing transposase RayT
VDGKLKYRRHIRLKGFDYSSSHYYFVTVCTRNRREFFEPRVSKRYGHELPGFVVAAGPWPAQSVISSNIVEQKLSNIEVNFDVDLDFYCLMPDHLHFIIALGQARQGRAATSDPDKKPPSTLPWVINAFKGWCTRSCGKPIWQPNYYEHIIRSEEALNCIREYILRNPWVEYDEIDWKGLDPS